MGKRLIVMLLVAVSVFSSAYTDTVTIHETKDRTLLDLFMEEALLKFFYGGLDAVELAGYNRGEFVAALDYAMDANRCTDGFDTWVKRAAEFGVYLYSKDNNDSLNAMLLMGSYRTFMLIANNTYKGKLENGRPE